MRHLMLVILLVGLVLIVAIPIAGCTPSEPKPFPPPEGYESWDEYYEGNQSSSLELRELLQYREFDSFTTGAKIDVWSRAAKRGYDLPNEIVEYPDCALYVVVQNLDDVPGKFNVRYTLTTADKEAAERQNFLTKRTPEEYEELDREYYEGSVELYLEPSEIGVAICPPDGIYIASDRVYFGLKYDIVPDTKTVEK